MFIRGQPKTIISLYFVCVVPAVCICMHASDWAGSLPKSSQVCFFFFLFLSKLFFVYVVLVVL